MLIESKNLENSILEFPEAPRNDLVSRYTSN